MSRIPYVAAEDEPEELRPTFAGLPVIDPRWVSEHRDAVNIIDVRTLSPLDIDTLAASVKKTGRCLVAHEATRYSGFGGELIASVQEECFYHLEAPIERVAGWDTPYPHAFEWQYFPGQKRIAAGIRKVMEAQ